MQALSAGVMTAVGMWACRWRELKPISFGGGGVAAAVAEVEQQVMMDVEANAGDGVGFVQGKRGGSIGESGGDYEMVDRAERA
jgi:protein SYS1